MDYERIMVASVGVAASALTDEEVSALFLALQMGEIEPHHLGYEKLASLRTNPDGTMHQATIEALITYLQQRISQWPL